MNVGGGCEAGETARKRCWWVRFVDCGRLFNGRRFLLQLKVTVYKRDKCGQ